MPLELAHALLGELFLSFREPFALGDVGSHGFDPGDVFLLVEEGEGLVLLDLEDQVAKRPQRLSQGHEVAFEVPPDEVLGADEGHFSRYGTDLLPPLPGEGERKLLVAREVPLVEEDFPLRQVVEAAKDGFEHGERVDLRARDLHEDAGRRRGEEVEHRDVEGSGQGDEVIGGELTDPVAGDGALGVGDHGFTPLLPGNARQEPGDLTLGEPAALA